MQLIKELTATNWKASVEASNAKGVLGKGYCWSKASPTIDASYLREHDPLVGAWLKGYAQKAVKCLTQSAKKGGCQPVGTVTNPQATSSFDIPFGTERDEQTYSLIEETQ